MFLIAVFDSGFGVGHMSAFRYVLFTDIVPMTRLLLDRDVTMLCKEAEKAVEVVTSYGSTPPVRYVYYPRAMNFVQGVSTVA